MKTQHDLITRLIDIKAELDARKALYEEYDEIVNTLAEQDFIRAEIGELVINFKDNFANKNTAFTSAGVKRFDVEIISKDLDNKRKARAK